jgi:hypothetical protein
MIALLNGAAFAGQHIDHDQASDLIAQGEALLDRVRDLAGEGDHDRDDRHRSGSWRSGDAR